MFIENAERETDREPTYHVVIEDGSGWTGASYKDPTARTAPKLSEPQKHQISQRVYNVIHHVHMKPKPVIVFSTENKSMDWRMWSNEIIDESTSKVHLRVTPCIKCKQSRGVCWDPLQINEWARISEQQQR